MCPKKARLQMECKADERWNAAGIWMKGNLDRGPHPTDADTHSDPDTLGSLSLWQAFSGGLKKDVSVSHDRTQTSFLLSRTNYSTDLHRELCKFIAV